MAESEQRKSYEHTGKLGPRVESQSVARIKSFCWGARKPRIANRVTQSRSRGIVLRTNV